MALTLSYDTYSFTIAPALGVTRSVDRDAARDRIGVRERWRLSGALIGDGSAALATAVAAFQTAFATDARDLVLADGGTPLLSLTAAACHRGPHVLECRIGSEASDDPGASAFATHVPFVLVIEGLRPESPADAVHHHHYARETISGPDGRQRTRTRGELLVAENQDAAALLATVLPALAPGARRVELTTDEDPAAKTLRYVAVDEVGAVSLPSGVVEGMTSRRETFQATGLSEVTVGGRFVGPLARQAAAAARPRVPLVAQEIVEHPESQTVEFSYTASVPQADGNLLVRQEHTTFRTTERLRDWQPLAAGAPVYRQRLGARTAEVTQAGEAIGRDRHPLVPQARFPRDVTDREITYEAPRVAPGGGRTHYRTRWRYVMRPRHAPRAAAPPS